MEDFPVYKKIENYKEVLDIIELLKHKIEELKELTLTFEELKSRESEIVSELKSGTREISQRIERIDSELLTPK
jgi:FtsZ-binding cell division protein ZapB